MRIPKAASIEDTLATMSKAFDKIVVNKDFDKDSGQNSQKSSVEML
jgi:hypothetical protein